MPRRVWLRLTSLFGLPDDSAEVDGTICAAIGPILRADSDDLVRAPLPAQLSLLLRQIAKGEDKLSAAPSNGSARYVPNLVVEIADQCNGHTNLAHNHPAANECSSVPGSSPTPG